MISSTHRRIIIVSNRHRFACMVILFLQHGPKKEDL